MKNLVLIVVGIMLLTGSTVSVLWWMKIGPFADPNAVAQGEERKAKGNETIFIDMEPLVIPIFEGDTVKATVQIQVKLETNSSDSADTINRMMPRISDLFIRDLHGFMPRLLKKQQGIDVLVVKQRLKLISDKLIGPDLIQNILVQSVVETPVS